MIIQAGGKLDFKKTVCQRRTVGLADDRYIIKGVFLAVSKETPPYEQGFVQITLEDDSKYVRATEKELQNKVRRIDLKRFIDRKSGQIYGIIHLYRQGFILLEGNVFKRIGGSGWI